MGALCGAPRSACPQPGTAGSSRAGGYEGFRSPLHPSRGAVLRAPPAQLPSQLHYLQGGSSHGPSPTRSLSCSTVLLGADQPLTAGPPGRPAFAPTPWHSGSSARVPSHPAPPPVWLLCAQNLGPQAPPCRERKRMGSLGHSTPSWLRPVPPVTWPSACPHAAPQGPVPVSTACPRLGRLGAASTVTDTR